MKRGAGDRLREPGDPGADRAHQPQRHRGGRGGGLLLRARPVEPARLRHRRQHRHELGRRALPEVRRDHQQPARRDPGADGRHGRRARRRASRRAGLRPARAGLRLGGPARRRHRGDAAHPAQARGGAAGADGLRLERGRRRLRQRHHPRRRAAGGDRVHGPAVHPRLRGLRPCRLSGRRGAADRRGRGLGGGDRRAAGADRRDRRAPRAGGDPREPVGGGERADLEGAQVGLRGDGADRRLHLPRRHHPGQRAALRAAADRRADRGLRARRSPTSSTPATATCIR